MLRRFLVWLLKTLIGEPPQQPPSKIIEVVMGGEIIRVAAKGIAGLCVVCDVPRANGSPYTYLIRADQACDALHFWALWRQFGGVATWEDGTPFEPEKS